MSEKPKKEKRPREITTGYIRKRFYAMYFGMTAGQKEGVWEALGAMDLLAEQGKRDEPEATQPPPMIAAIMQAGDEPDTEAEEGEAD